MSDETPTQPRGENGHGPGEFSERSRLPAESQVTAALVMPPIIFPSGTHRALSEESVRELVWALDAVMRYDGVFGRSNTVTRTIDRRQPAVGEVASVDSKEQAVTVHFRTETDSNPDTEELTTIQAIVFADQLEEEFSILPEAEYYEYLEYLDDLDAASEQL